MSVPFRPSRSYLVCWKWHEFDNSQGILTYGSIGNQIRHKQPNDRLFICATDDEEVYLGGVIDLRKMPLPKQRSEHGDWYARGANPTGKFRRIPLRALKWQLRFISPVAVKLLQSKSLIWQLRQHRRLEPSSADGLMQLLQGSKHANVTNSIKRRKQDLDGFIWDGRAITRSMTIRERRIRARALRDLGTDCKVCGMNFAQRYGPEFEECVHVHHLRQLARTNTSGALISVKHVIVVCPNCHAALHRTDDPGDWRTHRQCWGFR